MRHPLSDEEFEQALTGAQRSLWRFEQQPAYVIDDEGGLFAAFQRGEILNPTQAPGLRAWFDQVRTQAQAGLHIGRVRVVDNPPTTYQRWLQVVDRWNRTAGEEIYYLPRWAITNGTSTGGLHRPPFDSCDWWLIDKRLVVVMHINAAGVRTKVELIDEGPELADAIQFAWRAERAAQEIARETTRHAA